MIQFLVEHDCFPAAYGLLAEDFDFESFILLRSRTDFQFHAPPYGFETFFVPERMIPKLLSLAAYARGDHVMD